MGGLLQPTPATEESSSRGPILAGVAAVLIIMGLVAFLLRSKPKPPVEPPPYAASLQFSDLKMSKAANFVGASVTYIDGTITNAGSKTVTHAMVAVTFRDDIGQIAQKEDVPLHVLQTTGLYPDSVDLKAAPLKPGQSQTFRLAFESVSLQWNQAYPELQIIGVNLQ
jgi:hypothetical protein